MSKVKVQGNPSGTGTLTIAAPDTNSDFTLSLPATTAPILAGSGITLSASAPANTLVTDASGNVGIGATPTTAKLHVDGGPVRLSNSGGGEGGEVQFLNPASSDIGLYVDVATADLGRIFSIRNNFGLVIGQLGGTGGTIGLHTEAVERMRIAANGQQSSVIPGGSTLYPEFKCRAWVNFNGTGTPSIRASGNVSSITDNGTGLYTVNFTTALPDTNYAVTGCAADSPSSGSGSSVFLGNQSTYAPTTTSCPIGVGVGGTGLRDREAVTLSFFR